MNFQMRPKEGRDKNKYSRYLKNIKKGHSKLPSALVEYFAVDFFHDGKIEKLRFSDDMKTFSFRVSGENIKRFRNDGEFDYVDSVWFNCTFYNVVQFFIQAKKMDKLNDPISVKEKVVIFLQSEINTLDKQIKFAETKWRMKFNSLIIKTLPVERDFSIVFSSIKVEAENKSLFAKLKKSKEIRFPKLDYAIKGNPCHL
jgi:hypothetical protein